MSGALVVGAAPASGAAALAYYRRLLAGAPAIVAADAAGEWCVGLGRAPDLVVGDFDSAQPGASERLAAAGSLIEQHSEAKDETDLDLAITAALRRFGPPAVLTAAFSERLDHTLAAVGSLLRAGVGARALEPFWSASPVHPGHPLALDIEAGTVVSLVAPGGAAGVTITGVRWELHDARLTSLSGLGISNAASGGRVSVSCAHGGLVLFVTNTPDRGGYTP
jgi:thiamine pyrophosphokinase